VGLGLSTTGSEVVAANCPAGKLGLTVCYDLRFPELYQRLRFAENAEVSVLYWFFVESMDFFYA
jgi:predicted amidohydrolase